MTVVTHDAAHDLQLGDDVDGRVVVAGGAAAVVGLVTADVARVAVAPHGVQRQVKSQATARLDDHVAHCRLSPRIRAENNDERKTTRRREKDKNGDERSSER